MSEYYDRGFTPNIKKFVGRDHQPYLETWGMLTACEPVPSEWDRRTAAAFGRILSRAGEFAVIALAVAPKGKLRDPEDASWFCGVGDARTVLGADDPLIAILDAAEIPVPNLSSAFNHLGKLLPYKEFMYEPQVHLPGIETRRASIGEPV